MSSSTSAANSAKRAYDNARLAKQAADAALNDAIARGGDTPYPYIPGQHAGATGLGAVTTGYPLTSSQTTVGFSTSTYNSNIGGSANPGSLGSGAGGLSVIGIGNGGNLGVIGSGATGLGGISALTNLGGLGGISAGSVTGLNRGVSGVAGFSTGSGTTVIPVSTINNYVGTSTTTARSTGTSLGGLGLGSRGIASALANLDKGSSSGCASGCK